MKNDTQSSTPNRPSHRIYAVTKRANGDTKDWTEVGAAWSHGDGKGFSLRLEYLPLNGGELVLREPKPKAEQAPADTAEFDGAGL